MSEWKTALLGSATRVVSGTTPRTEDASAWNGDVVWVTPADLGQLRSGRILTSARRITRHALLKYGLEVIPAGSVVISSRAPIGHLAVADVDIVTNQGCKSFVPGSDLDGEFLYWLLRFRLDEIRALGAGATFAEVSKSTLESFAVSFPPLDEQRRIAARMRDAFAHARSAAEAIDARLFAIGQQRDAVVSDAFRGTAATARPLGTIGHLTDGDWILTADYAPSGVRLLQVGDVGRGNLTPKSSRYITAQRAVQLRCTLLHPGDVLISRMPDPLGRACLLPDLGYPAITAVDVTIMRLDPSRTDPDFVVAYLNSREWYEAVASKASGATRARISRRNLEALTIPVPSLGEQRRIAAGVREKLDEIDRAKAALAAQRAATAMLPAVLLREVFGEAVEADPGVGRHTALRAGREKRQGPPASWGMPAATPDGFARNS